MPLLTFNEALAAVRENIRPLQRTEAVPLGSAMGHILAEPILADDSYPRFDNSAVDGYAIGRADDAATGSTLKLAGAVSAGEDLQSSLAAGRAVQVFTGAPVPRDAYAVVMQEDVHRSADSDTITLTAAAKEGQHIRRAGSEIRREDRLLEQGAEINAGAVSILALVGKTNVPVRVGPRVAVVTTGDELVDMSESPVGGQIRDTSQPMLAALARQWGATAVSAVRIPDDPAQLKSALRQLADWGDLIVVAGGVSVGGKDFLPASIGDIGTTYFHGVSMRPGKPLLFGSVSLTPVFGLPGNPASSFVACQVFVREAMRLLRGASASSLIWVEAYLGEDHKPCGREDFIRVALEWREGKCWADPHHEQAAFGLRSLVTCQALARLPADRPVPKGEPCQVLIAK